MAKSDVQKKFLRTGNDQPKLPYVAVYIYNTEKCKICNIPFTII